MYYVFFNLPPKVLSLSLAEKLLVLVFVENPNFLTRASNLCLALVLGGVRLEEELLEEDSELELELELELLEEDELELEELDLLELEELDDDLELELELFEELEEDE